MSMISGNEPFLDMIYEELQKVNDGSEVVIKTSFKGITSSLYSKKEPRECDKPYVDKVLALVERKGLKMFYYLYDRLCTSGANNTRDDWKMNGDAEHAIEKGASIIEVTVYSAQGYTKKYA